MLPILVIGQSHGKAFVSAAREDGRAIQPFLGRPEDGIPGRHEGAEFTPELREALASGAVVLSCIGGNTHTRLALMQFERPFDFVLGEQPDLPLQADAEILPQSALRQTLERRFAPHRAIMAAVAAGASGRVFHAESPPPSADTEAFRASIAEAAPGDAAPPLLRYKMWRLHSALVREACEELGMTFMPIPPEASDADGMLQPQYFSNATHANADYARLVWRDLDARL